MIIVFSISDRRSFDKVKEWVTAIEENCEKMPSIVLVGNKTDLIDEEEVKYEEAKSMVKANWGFVYSSAKDHKNIDQVFQKVIELVVNAEARAEQEKDKKLEKELKLKRE